MDIGHRAQRIVALPLALLMAVAMAYAAADAITASRPAPADPSFFDTIIASDAVVAAIRIAVVAAAGYIVISVLGLISRRQWLTVIGPVRAEEPVSELRALYERRTVELVEAQQSIEELKTQLAATTELLNTVTHGDTIEDPGSGDPE